MKGMIVVMLVMVLFVGVAAAQMASVPNQPFGQACSGTWSWGGYSSSIELRLVMVDAIAVRGHYDVYPAAGGRALVNLPVKGEFTGGTLSLSAPANEGYRFNASVNGQEVSGTHYHPVPGFEMSFRAVCK